MIPGGLRILVATQPIDMRCSIDGLVAAVAARLGQDVAVERALYVFANARRDRAKMVWRNAHGWCLLYTRLDSGFRVTMPATQNGEAGVTIDARTLAAILDGTKARPTTREVVREARVKVANPSPNPTRTR